MEGISTTSKLDRDKQIIDESFLKRAYPEWATTFGNIRYLHQPRVVGHVLTCSDWDDEAKGFYITAKISDPTTWQQIEDGELNGFSIGIKNPTVIPDSQAENGRLIDGEVIETSVVDIPSAYAATFQVVKSPTAATFDQSSNSWQVIKTSQAESFEDKRNRLASAYNDHFGNGGKYSGYVVKTFPDKVIVCNWCWDSDDNTYFEVPYTEDGDDISFGQPVEMEQQFVPVDVQKSAVAEVYKRYYSQKERDDMPEEDFAGPHKSFPIKTQKDVDDAAKLIGHADDPDAVKHRIIEIAHRKGFKIPDAWKEDDKAEKTLDTSSGLQPYNLEGESETKEKEEKSTVADEKDKTDMEEKGMSAEEAKAAVASIKDTIDSITSTLEEIRSKMDAMARQSDPDFDGDIDNDKRPEEMKAKETEGGLPVETAKHDAENSIYEMLRDGLKTVLADPKVIRSIADQVSKTVSADVDTITKSVTADQDGIKGLIAGVQKTASDLSEKLSVFEQRLEVVEQSPAAPKGVTMVISGQANKTVEIADEHALYAEAVKTASAKYPNVSPTLRRQLIDEEFNKLKSAQGGNK